MWTVSPLEELDFWAADAFLFFFLPQNISFPLFFSGSELYGRGGILGGMTPAG